MRSTEITPEKQIQLLLDAINALLVAMDNLVMQAEIAENWLKAGCAPE